jgi:PAS domain S-box-containing protein
MAAEINPLSVSRLVDEDARELYEDAPCGYLSTLPDGMIIKINATFSSWTGYDADTLIGKKRFQELLPVAGRVFHDTHFGPLLLMQDLVKELAFEIVCNDGQRLPVLLNASLKRDSDGKPMLIRITLLDARGRRAYEEELRLAKRRAEEANAAVKRLNDSLEERVEQRTQERDRIWRNAQDMLVVASIQGRIVSFNPALTRTIGWTLDEMEGVKLTDLTLPEHRAELVGVAARLSAGEPVGRFEMPCRTRDGQCRWISWTLMPEGELIYGSGRDVTEEKAQAETLRKTEIALRQSQKMEAIGKLTGGVAHDFNNILQVIAGNLELLMTDIRGNAQADHRARLALAAVDRGAKLASQLLAFARRQPLQPLPVNMGRTLREMDDSCVVRWAKR